MNIAATLANVRAQRPVDPARVAVLVCPPTRWWRIRADRALPDVLLRLLGWDSDFVRTMATERFATVQRYWREVGGPVATALHQIARRGTCVVRDATFRQFVLLYQSGRYDVVCLVAHHLQEHDAPEFSDGPIPLAEIRSVTSDGGPALLLFCCTSAEWRDDLVEGARHQMLAAGAPWRLPFRHATLFLLYCLREINGTKTLEEAVARAVLAFTSRSNDEV